MKMINIENLNSEEIGSIYIDQVSIVSKLDFLANKASKIPVYLINEELMDFLYPPYKRRLMDPVIAKEIIELDNVDEIKKNLDNIFRKEIERTNFSVFYAVGLYLHKPSLERTNSNDKFKEFINKMKFPCICICPERVRNWADELNISSKTLFEKVYYHELGHAYIYSNIRDYTKPWYRIVEESYCNAVALQRFTNKEERAEIVYAISKQPEEYRGYTIFFSYSNFPYFYEILDIDEIEYLWHRFWRRYGIPIFYNAFGVDLQTFSKLWKDRRIYEDFFILMSQQILKEVIG